MAEIKSTLELALERTKKFTLSEKEKEEIKGKEVQQKAAGLSRRYREGQLHLHEIQKEIDRMDEKMGKKVKDLLLSEWIDALSLEEKCEGLLKGIEWLKEKDLQETRREILQLYSQYQKEKEKMGERLKIQSIEALTKEGIAGEAVEPNIEKGELWKKEKEKLNHSYRVTLEGIKEHLRNL